MLPLAPETSFAIAEPVTRPFYFVYMGFSTPLRFSTIETTFWDGYSWLAQSFSVQLGGPTLSVFNEDTLFGQVVLVDGTAGRTVEIYQGYANDSLHPNPVMVYSGEMGSASIGDKVVINCKQAQPKKTPRHYCTAPVFNHLPRAGTRFETPKGPVVLESR